MPSRCSNASVSGRPSCTGWGKVRSIPRRRLFAWSPNGFRAARKGRGRGLHDNGTRTGPARGRQPLAARSHRVGPAGGRRPTARRRGHVRPVRPGIRPRHPLFLRPAGRRAVRSAPTGGRTERSLRWAVPHRGTTGEHAGGHRAFRCGSLFRRGAAPCDVLHEHPLRAVRRRDLLTQLHGNARHRGVCTRALPRAGEQTGGTGALRSRLMGEHHIRNRGDRIRSDQRRRGAAAGRDGRPGNCSGGVGTRARSASERRCFT